jgi:tRNA pseudouridine13 synthase
VIEKYPDITQGLESFGLRQQRRATRLIPQSLSYDYPDENSLRLKFLLPVGTFATTILRELITIRESVKVAN